MLQINGAIFHIPACKRSSFRRFFRYNGDLFSHLIFTGTGTMIDDDIMAVYVIKSCQLHFMAGHLKRNGL